MNLVNWLAATWYRAHPIRWLLSPLSGLYRLITYCRRVAYQRGWLTSHKLPVPVIVVGNITVGGTGKTPFVIALAEQLTKAGYRPGIISRGYGSQTKDYPFEVTSQASAKHAGDEPLLLAQRTHCPVVIDPLRVRAAQYLLTKYPCDVIISDDGLQHYALQRDIEIVLLDAQRQLGNGFCLPAGPLREPASRLKQVDFIVYNGQTEQAGYQMTLQLQNAIQLTTGRQQPITYWQDQTVHAVAGIGHPTRFFDQLTTHGLTVIPHAFADHHPFNAVDVTFSDNFPIFMTEKDAVKCRDFATSHMWSVPVNPTVDASLWPLLFEKLRTSHG